MKVKNQQCIRTLSFRQLKAGKARNLTAVAAITLTTLLFTALFTIAFSLNQSYQEYTFRQIGGNCDGTFKNLDRTQVETLSKNQKIDAYGLRTLCGYISEPPFSKKSAEISYMDANCTRWSYALPETGRMPEKETEIAMDTEALKQLGIPAALGEKVTLTYLVSNTQLGTVRRTDTFTLSGFWTYDPLMPCHYLNVSKAYVEKVEADYVAAGGDAFLTDMNVMLPPAMDLEKQMQKILTGSGYQSEDPASENYVKTGVNWGLTSENLFSNPDWQTLASVAAILVLILLTGYLIIYNIFRISVSTDIRFYGLLKTIGTTPRQLRRMVRLQALYLCALGIPAGCLAGYGTGVLLVPFILSSVSDAAIHVKTSASPLLFMLSALFALFTVFLSCRRPARMAAKISPVEAVRYTETGQMKRKKKRQRTSGHMSTAQMAWRNLGRNRGKTGLVIASLTLSVVLLNLVFTFTQSFDMDTYLSTFSPVDFLVGNTDYLVTFQPENEVEDAVVREIQEQTQASLEGSAYRSVQDARCWVDRADIAATSYTSSEEELETFLSFSEQRGDLYDTKLQTLGMDALLLEKLTVLEGDLAPLSKPESHAIALAIEVDDNGKRETGISLKPGDPFTVTYTDEEVVYDSRTHTPADASTPEEYLEWEVTKSHDVTYTICALVSVPYKLGFRFSTYGCSAVLPTDTLRSDSQAELSRLYYAFDTPTKEDEKAAEEFLSGYTKDSSTLSYESKALMEQNFNSFKNMFLLVGGMLCIIIGVIGVLNFFNAIFTGIHARLREFAVMQSVGMTGKQLKQMLSFEGLLYSLCTILTAFVLSFILNPIAGNLLENMFWFCRYRFTVAPILVIAPVFFLAGGLLPLALYRVIARETIVERLRRAE